jgi:hypothetical protein
MLEERMRTIILWENPHYKEAMECVKAHVYIPVSDQEFIAIEKYVAERCDSLFSDGEYLRDGDLIRYVCGKLEEDNMLIPQIKVKAIVCALHDFIFDSGTYTYLVNYSI